MVQLEVLLAATVATAAEWGEAFKLNEQSAARERAAQNAHFAQVEDLRQAVEQSYPGQNEVVFTLSGIAYHMRHLRDKGQASFLKVPLVQT